MPADPLPIIQVGLGPWGQDWATTVLPRTDQVTVVARVDTDPARAALGDDVPAFTSLGDALAAAPDAAVLVTARIEAHHAIAKQALAAGRHVLLEKPFTATLDEARELNDLAARHQVALCVAQNYRFWPVVQAVRGILAEGTLGEVVNVRVHFRRDHGAYGPSVAAAPGAPTGSILFQISVHHVDLVRALLGEVRSVAARRWDRATLPGRLTAVSALLELESGVVVEYSADQATRAPETPWSGAWVIEGTQGSLRWGGGPTAEPDEVFLELTAGAQTTALPVPPAPYGDREHVLREFVGAVGGRPTELAGASNIATLRIILDAVGDIDAAASREWS